MKRNLVDTAEFVVKAGDGGKGAISFRREKYVAKGGPDGGDGGEGGSVILRADKRLSTLRFFAGKDRFAAKAGQPGSKRQRFGEGGENTVLNVPAGTVVWVKTEDYRLLSGRSLYGDWYEDEFVPGMKVDKVPASSLEERFAIDPTADLQNSKNKSDNDGWVMVADLDEDGDEIVIARGGRGGKGNVNYKSSRQTTPRFAQTGEKGERFLVRLELKVLADVGLVGLPNAGKSTMLSRLSRATPEIADYPFTTLSPNLGVLETKSREVSLVVADIPGLIEDAHKGKGLGDAFLRHVERCRLLVHVIAPTVEQLALIKGGRKPKIDDANSFFEEFWRSYRVIRRELGAYKAELGAKEEIVVLNKIDLIYDLRADVRQFFADKGVDIKLVSAATGEGMDELVNTIAEKLAHE